MRYVLAALLAFSSALADGTVVVRRTPASVTNPDIIFYLNFESGDAVPYVMTTTGASAEYSAGPTSGSWTNHGSAGLAANVDTTASLVGTYGLHVRQDGTASGEAHLDFVTGGSEDIIFGAEGTIGMWVYVVTNWSTRSFVQLGSTANGKMTMAGSNSNTELTFYNPTTGAAANDQFTSGGYFATGAWRFLQMHWVQSTGVVSWDAYDGSSHSGSNTAAWTVGNYASANLYFGVIGTVTSEFYIDNIMISNLSTRNFITDTAACGPGGSTVAMMNCVKSPR